MDLKLLKMLCKDSKQHHVIFHEFYSVSSLLCIAQNVRFEIPYKVLYFETPFLMVFKYYACASYASNGCYYMLKYIVPKPTIPSFPTNLPSNSVARALNQTTPRMLKEKTFHVSLL